MTAKTYKLFIGGNLTNPENGRFIPVIDKRNKNILYQYPLCSAEDVQNAVSAARTGFNSWRVKSDVEKSEILTGIACLLDEHKEMFAKYLPEGKAKAFKEIDKAGKILQQYAGLADKWYPLMSTVNPVQEGYFCFSIPEPMGIVAVLLPEELPLISMITAICPVILTGNSCVVISSESHPLAALNFGEILKLSGLPAGVINILTGYKKEIIIPLASHMDVNAFYYCDSDPSFKKDVKIACAGNIKRFITLTKNGKNENRMDAIKKNLHIIKNFVHLKTVWHTVGA
jgi:acyl-CoA reductase-like NAD-dependent aldehyde dehydrogenase